MDNFFKQIRDNWPILFFIGGIIFTWSSFNSRLATAEDKISEQSKKIETLNSIDSRLSVIETEIKNINSRLKISIIE